MGKEIKIGVGVIGVLLIILGGAIVYRLQRPNDTAIATLEETTDEASTAADEATDSSADASETSKTPVDPFAASATSTTDDRYGADRYGESRYTDSYPVSSDAGGSTASAAPSDPFATAATTTNDFATDEEPSNVATPNAAPGVSFASDDDAGAQSIPAVAEQGSALPASATTPASDETTTPQTASSSTKTTIQVTPAEDAAATDDDAAADVAEGGLKPAGNVQFSPPDRYSPSDRYADAPAAAGSAGVSAGAYGNENPRYSDDRNSAANAPPVSVASQPASRRRTQGAVDPFGGANSTDPVDAASTQPQNSVIRTPQRQALIVEEEESLLGTADSGTDAGPLPSDQPAASRSWNDRDDRSVTALGAASASSLRDDFPAARDNRAAIATADSAEEALVRLEPGEDIVAVAERVYGDSNYADVLAAHNQQRYPDARSIRAGDVISAPPPQTLVDLYPDYFEAPQPEPEPEPVRVAENDARFAPPGRSTSGAGAREGTGVYVVREGDTLFDIARYHLGKASRWAELYELNRQQLGDDLSALEPGTRLRLPPR